MWASLAAQGYKADKKILCAGSEPFARCKLVKIKLLSVNLSVTDHYFVHLFNKQSVLCACVFVGYHTCAEILPRGCRRFFPAT